MNWWKPSLKYCRPAFLRSAVASRRDDCRECQACAGQYYPPEQRSHDNVSRRSLCRSRLNAKTSLPKSSLLALGGDEIKSAQLFGTGPITKRGLPSKEAANPKLGSHNYNFCSGTIVGGRVARAELANKYAATNDISIYLRALERGWLPRNLRGLKTIGGGT